MLEVIFFNFYFSLSYLISRYAFPLIFHFPSHSLTPRLAQSRSPRTRLSQLGSLPRRGRGGWHCFRRGWWGRCGQGCSLRFGWWRSRRTLPSSSASYTTSTWWPSFRRFRGHSLVGFWGWLWRTWMQILWWDSITSTTPLRWSGAWMGWGR